MIVANLSHLQLPDVLATMKSRFSVSSGSQPSAEKAQESSVQNAALAELDKYGTFKEESDLLPIVVAHSSICNAKELMQKEAELVSLVEETKAKILDEEPDLDEPLALIKAIHQNEGIYQKVKDTVHEVALDKAFKGKASDMLAMTKVKGFDINRRGEDGETLLTTAAEAGRIDVINALLELDGIDVNQTCTTKEDTPLIKAARQGHLDVVEALLNYEKTDKHCVNQFKVTPLMVAAQGGHIEVVKALLNAGVDIDAVDDEQTSVLMVAALNGKDKVVKELIDAGADFKAKDKDNDTALIIASIIGHLDAIKELLKVEEPGVNIQGNNSYTALHQASHNGHLDVVKELVNAGADCNIQDKHKRSPLAIAARNGHFDIVLELLKVDGIEIKINAKNPLDSSLLFLAAQNGRMDVLEALIEKGVDVNEISIVGNTAISAAAEKGHLEFVKRLLKAGAEVNHNAINGCTPLILAVKKGHINIVKELLNAGASVVKPENFKLPLLSVAVAEGHLEIVQELLKVEGINVDEKGVEGIYALEIAAETGHINIVKELLKAGANVNAQDDKRTTALHIAVQEGHVDVVIELLNVDGIDVDLINDKKYTPLDVAANYGHEEILVRLIKAGANPSTSAKNGISPLYLAASQGHLGVIKELLKIKDIDVDLVDSKEGLTALFVAAGYGHIDMAVALINARANPNASDKDRVTPLSLAVASGNLNMVNELLNAKGIDINAMDIERETAILTAIKMGYIDIVKALLSKRRSINLKLVDKHKRTPLMIAAMKGNLEIFNEVLKLSKALVNDADPQGNTALLKACEKGHVDVAKALLDVRAIDCTHTNKDGNGALHFAVTSGNLELVDEICKNKKIDPNQRNDQGNTPLIIAAKKGNAEAARSLLNHPGIDIMIANQAKRPPMAVAIESNHLNVVKEIVEHLKKTPDEHKNSVELAIIFAASLGREEIVEYLVKEPGIDINRVKGGEQSALKAAITGGNANIVRLLCNQPSIDVNVLLGEPKQSFLFRALVLNKLEIFKILLEHENINVNPPLVKNRTLLSIAAGCCRYKFVRELAKREDLRYEIKDAYFCYDALMYAVCAKDIEVIQELLKIDGINLNTEDAEGKSLFSLAAGQDDMTVLCTLISTGKIKFDSIKESDAYNEPVNKLIKDFRTSFKRIYKSKNIRNLSFEEYKDLIEKNKDNDLMLYIISKLNIKAAYIMARDHGERYLSILSNNLVDLQVRQDADEMPEPDQDVDVSVLLKLVDSHGLTEEVKKGVKNLVTNIKKRRAIAGLPNKERDPENFKRAYVKIEKRLQVIVIALMELDTMIDDDPEKDSKDPKEKLISLLNRIGEFGPFCGTRYMQEMPSVYSQQIALMTELKCVQRWSKKTYQIPLSASPELAIRSHMGDVLYPLRIEALKSAYEETKPPAARGNDVHFLSGFWKGVKEDFSLKDDVDTDPLAEKVRLSMTKVKLAFKEALKAEPIIDTATQHITLTGGDDNPYLGVISMLAGESRVGLPLEQVMEDVYEYDDLCVPTGIKKPFVGMVFQDLGLLH